MPALFGSLSGLAPLLTSSVGQGLDNNEDDVRKVAKSLKSLNYYDGDNDMMITKPLDTAIRRFQTDNGLKTDGILYPGGETERQIQGLKTRSSQPRHLAGLLSGVGRGQDNREDDVREIEAGLGALNYLPAVHKIQPRGFMTAGIEQGLYRFQTDNSLKQDGIALPGGETWQTLTKLVSGSAPVSTTLPNQTNNKYLADISDEDIRAFLLRSEDDVAHLYKDTTDNVTIGIGKMLPDTQSLDKIKFYILNEKREPIRRATQEEILSDFKRVQKQSKGMLASK